ncbi:hypothetical protein Tco_0620571 [Tanacetum coccineum]
MCTIKSRAKRSSINILRVLRIILLILPEYQSDTYVFTMKMEILLVPTSNSTAVEHTEYGESNTYVLERFNTSAGNPIKEILLKLNLPDHRSILTDSKRRSVKVKKLQEICTINAFKLSYQEKYKHVGPKVTSTQVGKRSQVDDNRLCLADALKKLKDHIQVKLKGTSSSLKSKDHCAYHKLKKGRIKTTSKIEDIHRML